MKGLRYNSGKLRYDLLPPEWEEALVACLTKGADKYAPRNWELGMEWSKCYASLRRHLNSWYAGENIDPESELNHLVHVAWNALALYSYTRRKLGSDDRPKGLGKQYEISYTWQQK